MGKIPNQAKKVFTGTLFDVYQWQQKLYDGSLATFEMIDRADTVCIIAITPNGEVVLIDHEQPSKPRSVELPGGRIDVSEDPLAAAKRELEEETGYTSNNWELWKTVEPLNKMNWNMYYFIARNSSQTEQPNPDAGEKITPVVVSVDEFMEKITTSEPRHPQLSIMFLQAKLDPTKWQSAKDFLLGKSRKSF